MAEYQSQVDIQNKALLHLGATMITTINDQSKNAIITTFQYDKCRVAELRAHVWQFAIAYSNLVLDSVQSFQNGAIRNRFLLPTGYIRLAQQDPHTAGVTNQGTSAGTRWGDYSVEGPLLLTANTSVLLRYVEDQTTVTAFDGMFDEALALRIAFDSCEAITQNLQKRQMIGQMYAERIGQAMLLNLIETATDEPMEAQVNLVRVNQNLNPPAPAQQRQR